MKEGLFKKRLIYLILLSQLLTLTLIIVLYLFGGFDQSEFFDLLYIYMPICLIYLSLCFIFIKNNRYLPNSKQVDKNAVYTVYILIGLWFFLQAVVVFFKAFYNWINMDVLKVFFCFTSSCAGVYAALTISKLLHTRKADHQGVNP